jgi:hypothetical protein
MQPLVPPVVGRNAEALDLASRVLHLRDFLFQRHVGDQIGSARFGRGVRIFKRGQLLGESENWEQRKASEF